MKEAVSVFIIIMILAFIAVIGISDHMIARNREDTCECMKIGKTKEDLIKCLKPICERE